MIDLHSHILAEVDDGSTNRDETLSLIALLSKVGFQKICATPHQIEAGWQSSQLKILSGLESATRDLKRQGLQVELCKGSEYNFDPNFLAKLAQGHVVTLGDSPYYLVEIAEIFLAHQAQAIGRQIIEVGKAHQLRPILAHPERYRDAASERWINMLREQGFLMQLNLPSLTSRDSRLARRALSWLKAGYYDGFGSDAHRPSEDLAARLASGLALIRKVGGEKLLEQLGNPVWFMERRTPFAAPIEANCGSPDTAQVS